MSTTTHDPEAEYAEASNAYPVYVGRAHAEGWAPMPFEGYFARWDHTVSIASTMVALARRYAA